MATQTSVSNEKSLDGVSKSKSEREVFSLIKMFILRIIVPKNGFTT